MTLFNSRNVVASIDYHSFGQLVLYPWGYTTAEIPNANEFLRPNTKTKDKVLFAELANKIATEIGGYTPQKSSALYPVSGGSEDWEYNTKHSASFVIEIGTVFQPPVAQIGIISQANIKGARWLMFWAVDQALKKKPAPGAP